MPVINLANFQQFTAINVLSDPGAIGGPVVVPQCAQITLRWTLDSGKAGVNVLYGRYTGAFAGTGAQAGSILTGLASGAQFTALAAFISNTQNLNTVTIRDVNTPNQPVIFATTGAPGAGTSASPSLPNEVAVAVTLRTAQSGRANRGRIFVPGWATNALGAGNIVAAGAVTALQNWANTIIGVLAAQGYTLVIGQKARAAYTGSSGTQHPARPATSTTVTSLSVRDNHWDSQRRRGLK